MRLLDFGLCRSVAGDADGLLTASGMVLGTPAYMAPEQADGAEVDARADLFSLGVTMCEMCTGGRPFDGKTGVSVMRAVATHHPPEAADVCAEIPRSVSDLIAGLLMKDPDHREPRTAAGVVTSCGSSKRAGRRRGRTGAAIAAVLALALALVYQVKHLAFDEVDKAGPIVPEVIPPKPAPSDLFKAATEKFDREVMPQLGGKRIAGNAEETSGGGFLGLKRTTYYKFEGVTGTPLLGANGDKLILKIP